MFIEPSITAVNVPFVAVTTKQSILSSVAIGRLIRTVFDESVLTELDTIFDRSKSRQAFCDPYKILHVFRLFDFWLKNLQVTMLKSRLMNMLINLSLTVISAN